MLPRELLVVQRQKNNIMPKYLQDIELAEEIIFLFNENKGKKYKELQKKLEELEGDKYKLVRGLSTLLERQCEFKPSSELNANEIRNFLFERGFVITEEERNKVLEQAAINFNVSQEAIEGAMFSDLEEEQILVNCDLPSSQDLVRQYNLSITQTLLFDALEMSFQVEGNYQQIFRTIKYLGLMYEINEEIKVTGPASLFKKTKKYGTSLAKLVPAIITAKTWKINAKIESKVQMEPRIFNFELDSETPILFPSLKESIIHFDSNVEAKFYQDFRALNSGWEIKREPGLIKAGVYVIIPDFGFYKAGLEHYLEIIGFWTPSYLTNKLAKLKKAEINITVAVNENLSCTKEDFAGNVIFYSKQIPLAPLIKILRELEEEKIEYELNRLGVIEISEDIVSLKEKAQELNILPETLTRIQIPNYYIIGEQLVSKRFLKKLKGEIKTDSYEQINEILCHYNLPLQALDYIGYKIIWKGLKPMKIVKKTK